MFHGKNLPHFGINFDNDAYPQFSPLTKANVNTLLPGRSKTVEFNQVAILGERFWIIVDPDGSVYESNEENNIFPLYESLKKVTASLEHRYDFEIIFTDNFSKDGSFEKIREIAQLDKSIRAYRFVKNFGNQKSILTGYIKFSPVPISIPVITFLLSMIK